MQIGFVFVSQDEEGNNYVSNTRARAARRRQSPFYGNGYLFLTLTFTRNPVWGVFVLFGVSGGGIPVCVVFGHGQPYFGTRSQNVVRQGKYMCMYAQEKAQTRLDYPEKHKIC